MKLLNDHPNVVKLKNIMRPKNVETFNDLNLVLEYCTQNLSNVIKNNKDTIKLGHI